MLHECMYNYYKMLNFYVNSDLINKLSNKLPNYCLLPPFILPTLLFYVFCGRESHQHSQHNHIHVMIPLKWYSEGSRCKLDLLYEWQCWMSPVWSILPVVHKLSHKSTIHDKLSCFHWSCCWHKKLSRTIHYCNIFALCRPKCIWNVGFTTGYFIYSHVSLILPYYSFSEVEWQSNWFLNGLSELIFTVM